MTTRLIRLRRSRHRSLQTGALHWLQHSLMVASSSYNIRTAKVRNNAGYAAHSTLIGVMGRMATCTGQVITWDIISPVKPDVDGWYPVAIPGTTLPV